MPRHTQPIEVARLKGADKKDPQRYRAEPPKSELPLGPAPDHLSDAAAECWFEISSYAIPGVLTGADRLMLETLAVYLADFRADPSGFPATKVGQMIGILGRLGMSPADRQKLGVEKPKEDNPYAALDA